MSNNLEQSGPLWRRAVLVLILIGACTVVGVFRVRANNVLREGRNAALSLRLMALYRQDCPYDPRSANGLAEGVEAELRELSQTEGDIVLTAWNTEKNEPEALAYTRGGMTARLSMDPETGQYAWTVEWRFAVLRYG